MEADQVSMEELRSEVQRLKKERDEAIARSNQLEAQLKSLDTRYPEPAWTRSSSSSRLHQRISVKRVLKEGKAGLGKSIVVCGWIRSIRLQGGGRFCFIELNDGSCFSCLQIVLYSDKEGFSEITSPNANSGASVCVEGEIVESVGSKQAVEVRAESVQLLGVCVAAQYPLGKKKISLEILRSLAHLRARTNTFGCVARIRNACALATHLFMQSQGLLYLHTPLITASDCEGAGEMFQVTTLLKNGVARISEVPLVIKDNKPTENIDYGRDFFGKPAYLTVSGQLNGEMYASALSGIYTFGPTFRAEDSHTSRHLAEFWMIEPEMAFVDLDGNMDLAEAYLKYVIHYVFEHCEEDLGFFDKYIEKGLIERLRNVMDTPFKRLTYSEAVEVLIQSGHKFDLEVKWGMDLKSEHERFLTEQIFRQPVILTHYPKEIKAFYMRLDDDGKTVKAMDVLVPKIGEILGGSQREERLEFLEKRIEELHMDKETYRHYLDLRRFGTCVHSGFGLGFERLLMFITGMENIRDVIPFPRFPGHADF